MWHCTLLGGEISVKIKYGTRGKRNGGQQMREGVEEKEIIEGKS